MLEVITLCAVLNVCTPPVEDALRHHVETWESPVVQVTPQVSSSVYRGMGDGNVEQWRGLVAAYFLPEDVDRALCLMKYESGGNPNAKNPTSTARGLMQVLASLWAPHFGVSYSDLYDPHTNISIAAKIKDSQGWTAWSPYNRGLCH